LSGLPRFPTTGVVAVRELVVPAISRRWRQAASWHPASSKSRQKVWMQRGLIALK
jgi:hypothetical protein